MKYDYSSIGFYTFDCLGWPFTAVPAGGGCNFIDELTLAVSGAAGTAAIAAAKMGLKTLAVGGVGQRSDGRLGLAAPAAISASMSRPCSRSTDAKTSSSIVTTRADGTRPALHMKGATGDFYVDDDMLKQVIDARVVHIGGIGLMDRMDKARNAELMKAAKAHGATTTLDIFAGSKDDLPAVAQVLPHIDYFIPSIEEAQALTGLAGHGRHGAAFHRYRRQAAASSRSAPTAPITITPTARVFQVPAFDIAGQMHLRLRRCLQCRLRRRALPRLRSGNDGALRAGDIGAQCHGPRLAGRRRPSSTRSIS